MSSDAIKAATEKDVQSGRAAYWIPDNRSQPYDLGVSLPALGILKASIGEECPIQAGEKVAVIQVELIDETIVLVGFVWKGQMGVCGLEEIEISTRTKGA